MFTVSDVWKTTYPGAFAGVLTMDNVANPKGHAALARRKDELQAALRARFSSRQEIKALPTVQAYNAYYKRFKKTYHVQLQLESVAVKGKPIPRIAALVEAMFMAELKNQLLTAGHDLDAVRPPVKLDVAGGSEQYVRLNGQEQALKAGDMFIADTQGILSSVIYGPDRRTQIRPTTTRALFTVYAPPGLDAQAVRQHLHDIETYAQLVAPQAETELLEVYAAL